MKRTVGSAVIAVFAMLTAFVSLAFAADNPPQPKIEVTPMTVDLGNISDDIKSNATFTIKNTGNADLVIIDAKPTCGCTVANLTSKKIAPGKTATLEAVYDSHNGNGQIRKFVNIKSNDPKAETVTLQLNAVVTPKPAPDVAFSLYNVMGLQMTKGGKESRTIKVLSNGQMPLVIDGVSTSPGISAKFGKVDIPAGQNVKTDVTLKPGESKDLSLTISPKTQSGFFQEVLTIRSNSKHHPALTFVAQGQVK